MSKTTRIGRLHVLTDFFFQQVYSHARLAQLALVGGADTIQFRQKHGGVRHKIREAKSAASICQKQRQTLLVNDRVDIALAVGADGVHLGQSDLSIRIARELLGRDAIIGATATNRQQAVMAFDEGADYIGFGPVFQTRSKANPASVKGLDTLASVCAAVPIPIIAIAGITPERTYSVLQAGAYGVAVMTAITTSRDPVQATSSFRSIIDGYLGAGD